MQQCKSGSNVHADLQPSICLSLGSNYLPTWQPFSRLIHVVVCGSTPVSLHKEISHNCCVVTCWNNCTTGRIMSATMCRYELNRRHEDD